VVYFGLNRCGPAHGDWFAETTREGTLIGDGRKAFQWKANYHTARAMMNVARMLGDMEKTAAPAGAM
jgi:mannobiose 2-epimerase